MSKQKSLTWSQLKAKLSDASQQQLLDIIRDLCKLNPDNKVGSSGIIVDRAVVRRNENRWRR